MNIHDRGSNVIIILVKPTVPVVNKFPGRTGLFRV